MGDDVDVDADVVVGDDVDVDADVVVGDDVDADVDVVPVLASAGSWPEASWTTIPPVLARNSPAATPITRRRMTLTRRRRARSCGEGRFGP